MQYAGHKVHIVAEIGTAHGGSIKKAEQLIHAAAQAGADFIKFQWVYADEILHPDTGFVALPGGNVRLYDRFKELETVPDFFEKVQKITRDAGCGFICSPFGLKSLSELLTLQPDAIKIASPELNHFPLLQKLALYRAAQQKQTGTGSVPVILSSGVSRLSDIEKAVSYFPEYVNTETGMQPEAVKNPAAKENKPEQKLPPLTLLHCVTSYPAPETEYNMQLLKNLGAVFGLPTGVSDHSLDPILIPALAVLNGAVMIEKHITLSKNTAGLDDPVALEPDQFLAMTNFIRNMTSDINRQIQILETMYGKTTVQKATGSGIKRLAAAETANYSRTNRSIHVMRDMKAGSVLTADSIAILRTEKVLTVGLSPDFISEVTGAVLVKDAAAGEGLTWQHIIAKGSRAAR